MDHRLLFMFVFSSRCSILFAPCFFQSVIGACVRVGEDGTNRCTFSGEVRMSSDMNLFEDGPHMDPCGVQVFQQSGGSSSRWSERIWTLGGRCCCELLFDFHVCTISIVLWTGHSIIYI